MNDNTVKGAIKQATGAVEKEFGKMTGNTGHQVKGSVKETIGKAQKGFGQAQEEDADEQES